MTIADDSQNPKPAKKLSKSLDSIAALRIAMEQRLAEAQKEERAAKAAAPVISPPPPAPEPEPEPVAPPQVIKLPEEKPQVKVETVAPKPKPRFEAKPEAKSEQAEAHAKTHDPVEWSRVMFRIAERSQKLIQDFMERNKGTKWHLPSFDPAHVSEAYMGLFNRIVNDPHRFVDAQIQLWQGYISIWQAALERMQGKPIEPLVTPAPTDKRFKDKEWQTNWVFDYIKQSYLLTAKWVHGLVRQESEKLDPKLARKLEFYTRQMVDAISPSNFWLTNPEVLRTTLQSGGENLVKGLENMLADLERGNGQLRISMTGAEAFKVGENLATTPGKVVYQNMLMQLIQYEPVTPTVHKVPLLIVPPWINKFYILDMREKNSYIGYLVAQGYTVFCVSWVNPDKRHAAVHFDDYMAEGILACMREVRNAARSEEINIVGYCIGGTLLASTLAYLKNAPSPAAHLPKVNSATYLVTLTDFSEPGDLGVFMDEEQVKAIEDRMDEQGFLDAASMAATFNMLRSNDLIWSFVVNNYLLGREPFPFDILYWNMDSTNLPAAMHSFYLRKMYLENKLIEPNAVKMKSVPIDLHSIDTPSFMLSTREDHIAPWRSTYAATQIYKGPVKFVLSGSGHIAGIVNPPIANKYGYWTNDACPPDAEEWFDNATQHNGSWWPEWLNWLKTYSGEQVPARVVQNGIENAPGSYVRVNAV